VIILPGSPIIPSPGEIPDLIFYLVRKSVERHISDIGDKGTPDEKRERKKFFKLLDPPLRRHTVWAVMYFSIFITEVIIKAIPG
jgi:hypothetical protein